MINDSLRFMNYYFNKAKLRKVYHFWNLFERQDGHGFEDILNWMMRNWSKINLITESNKCWVQFESRYSTFSLPVSYSNLKHNSEV